MENIPSQQSIHLIRRVGITLASIAALASCASIPAPNEQMAIAKAAVSSASTAGGGEYAPLQFKSAVEKMDGADRAMADKDYERALQLAEQAQVDAQLAGAMALSVKARKAADTLQEDNRVLREELDRKAK